VGHCIRGNNHALLRHQWQRQESHQQPGDAELFLHQPKQKAATGQRQDSTEIIKDQRFVDGANRWKNESDQSDEGIRKWTGITDALLSCLWMGPIDKTSESIRWKGILGTPARRFGFE